MRSRCACCTPISIRRTNARSRRRSRATRARRRVLARGLARVPRVRAAWSRPLPTPRCDRSAARTSPGSRRSANEVLVMTSAGGLVPLDDAVAATGLAAPVGTGRRRAGRGRRRRGVRLPRCGVVRHGRHQHRRVPRPRRCARAGADARHRRLPDPAAGASPCTRSARVAARSRGSTAAARSSSGRRARAPGPGPACYGRGGERATVTDADLVLGRIPADARVRRARPPRCRRRPSRARRVPVSTAEGVVAVVDASMERAVRVVTVEQGIDPARPRAGRVRRRGAAPRVRCRRRARDARGDRARRARACSRPSGSCRRRVAASSCGRGRRRRSLAGLDRRAGRAGARRRRRRSVPPS